MKPDIRVVSNSDGVKLVRYVANPLKVMYGCVLVLKRDNVISARDFVGLSDKRDALLNANRMVLSKNNSETDACVRLIYGMKVHEYFKRYGYSRGSKA